ncbi:MAG TPA: glyoxalase superfamily protein [Microbacterium sp.]|uniref:glyoxalase superfamily protein n=1 Tax=Microbacterium sp. TaxID=51671 RepID=UPI002B4839A4|nr:glyoxalase superfamily protein [Microbacterium sp.]HKT56884.1 glyoxalase superfamily protein [Microbacterium sp.]
MDFKIELVFVPVSDVDRAKHFYGDQLGWNVDYDHTVTEDLRFVQITPPGSACSIAFGRGLIDMPVGSQRSVQLVIDDADAARDLLRSNGVDASDVDDQAWGRFVTFSDPDGNRWTLQQIPARS